MIEHGKLKNPIALFPLPGTVFFPRTELSLHIFELRYRQMIQDALDTKMLIGTVLLQPGYEESYFDKPDIYNFGCAGKVKKANRLSDGKFNIILEGVSRFRIREETGNNSYRMAQVDFLSPVNDDPLEGKFVEKLNEFVGRYEDLMRTLSKKNRQTLTPDLRLCSTVGEVADQIAYGLDWDAKRMQIYLEELDASKRMNRVKTEIDLKMQILHESSLRKQGKIDIGLN